jgi:hypothetical protein
LDLWYARLIFRGKMGWVKCTERLPDKTGIYLVKYCHGSIRKARLSLGKTPKWHIAYSKVCLFYGHKFITLCVSSRMKILYWKPLKNQKEETKKPKEQIKDILYSNYINIGKTSYDEIIKLLKSLKEK